MKDDPFYRRKYEGPPIGESPAPPPSPEEGPPEQAPPIGDKASKKKQPLIFTPTPFALSNPAKFRRRQFLYAHHYARRYLSTIIAAADVGKTTLAMTEYVAMAAGLPLLGVHFKGPLRVWYWNGEDPREELERRALAICKYHHIDRPEQIMDNLCLDSGRDMKLIVAETTRSGFTIATPVQAALTRALIDNKIDILAVDPFVKTHRVAENDNTLMDAVATVFAEIANDANCAVCLIQHARKTIGEVSLNDGRGAGSVVAATRMGRVANRMTREEADQAGVPEDQARFHVRVDAAKANMSPPDKATWFKLANVGLGNFSEDLEEDEDHVQVATPWKWPDPFQGVNSHTLHEVQRLLPEKPRRKDQRSPDWIGYLIIEVLKLDRDRKADKAKAKAILEGWMKNHLFKTVDGVDKKGEAREFVEINHNEYDD